MCVLSSQPSTESNEGSTVEDNQVDITSTDEGAQLWLEDLGVDRKSFPSLDPSKVRINYVTFFFF